MTSQNEEAEDLMRRIEKEEEALAYEFPERKVYHLCIVNLVIGTLYCSKGNFDFGINRVIKALEPFQKKLGTDTWFYVKVVFNIKHILDNGRTQLKKMRIFLDSLMRVVLYVFEGQEFA